MFVGIDDTSPRGVSVETEPRGRARAEAGGAGRGAGPSPPRYYLINSPPPSILGESLRRRRR